MGTLLIEVEHEFVFSINRTWGIVNALHGQQLQEKFCQRKYRTYPLYNSICYFVHTYACGCRHFLQTKKTKQRKEHK